MNSCDFKKIAVKIGTNVVTKDDGFPNIPVFKKLVDQVEILKRKGKRIIIISSGAVAAGRSMIKLHKKTDAVTERQLLSSLGQVKMMQIYTDLFAKKGLQCAQILVTKKDFSDRNHYLNMRNCLEALINNDIIPIVNENDVVSITELMFTDNDELAGLVSAMTNVDVLLILTNIDGVYDGDPFDQNSSLISVFDPKKYKIEKIACMQKSEFGRGGIKTKCLNAKKIANMGIPVYITNGQIDNVVLKICDGERLGTYFKPGRSTSSLKKWIAHSDGYAKGKIIINKGAKVSLLSDKAISLLPVGIIKVEGNFEKHDIIKIYDEVGNELGLGRVQYGHKKAVSLLGMKNQRPLIHYDYLFLYKN